MANRFPAVLIEEATQYEPRKMGHGTIATRKSALNDDFVEKTMRGDGYFKNRPNAWMDANISARRVVREIRAKRSDDASYNVPNSFISHGRVRDIYADGARLLELSNIQRTQNRGWIFPALGDFINDMSELRPTKVLPAAQAVHGAAFANTEDLMYSLMMLPDAMSEKNIQFTKQVFEYLRDLPENKVLVFAHGDLSPENIIVNLDTHAVNIIDFEMAGYKSQLNVMYDKNLTAAPALWDYVNKLPRTTNPNLKWNFDTNKKQLFQFIRIVSNLVYAELYHPENNIVHDVRGFLDIEIDCAKLAWARMRRGGAPREKIAMLPALKNHYQR